MCVGSTMDWPLNFKSENFTNKVKYIKCISIPNDFWVDIIKKSSYKINYKKITKKEK